MALFNPHLRAERMTVGTAVVLLQLTDDPVILGCAEVVANRMARCTAGGPALVVKEFGDGGVPCFKLPFYGQQVKGELEKRICLSAN